MKYKIFIDSEQCDGCGKCVNICKNSVILKVNHKVHHINEKYCEKDGDCINVCPKNAISFQPKLKEVCVGDDCFMNESELYNWPVKLTNVSCQNKYLEDSDLLICADCSAYAYANFHQDFIRDHVVLIACPKNDGIHQLLNKCKVLFENVPFNSISVISMSSTCCKGLFEIIQEALQLSGKNIQIHERMINSDGEVFE